MGEPSYLAHQLLYRHQSYRKCAYASEFLIEVFGVAAVDAAYAELEVAGKVKRCDRTVTIRGSAHQPFKLNIDRQ